MTAPQSKPESEDDEAAPGRSDDGRASFNLPPAVRRDVSPAPSTSKLHEYWDWFAVALFLLITIDMLTTRFAAVAAGAGAEINPIMRWVLAQNLAVLIAVNLTATVIAVGSFYVLMQLLESSPAPYDRYMAWGIEIWLGVLVAGGLFVFANNLSVIVLGQSLVVF